MLSLVEATNNNGNNAFFPTFHLKPVQLAGKKRPTRRARVWMPLFCCRCGHGLLVKRVDCMYRTKTAERGQPHHSEVYAVHRQRARAVYPTSYHSRMCSCFLLPKETLNRTASPLSAGGCWSVWCWLRVFFFFVFLENDRYLAL